MIILKISFSLSAPGMRSHTDRHISGSASRGQKLLADRFILLSHFFGLFLQVNTPKKPDMQNKNLHKQTEGCKNELLHQKSLKRLSVSMQSITLHLLSSPDFPPYKAT